MADVQAGHLLFSTGGSLFAFAADRAAEVVTLPMLTRVPGAPVHVLGVFAHRGEVVPVVDIAMLFCQKPDKAPRRAVVVKSHKGNVALTAEKVNGLTSFEGAFNALGDSGARQYLRGPAHTAEGEAAVIDLDGLLEMLSHGGTG